MTSTTAGDDPLDFNEKRTVSAESTGSEEDNNELITPPPTYDWENDKRKSELFDDGTMSFFWRAHTLTVLTISMAILFYVAVFEKETLDSSYNAKRGLLACSMFFLLFGVVITPDGPFIRPHPAHIDPELGKPLPDKDYGGSCRIYDWENSTDPFYSFRDKMDGFVLSHFIGWWLKTLILRDFWLCWVTSVGFEVLEYSLEHQLPNFSECWWDHVYALICNGGGIYLGMKTCEYLKMKPYNWRGLWKIPTVRGKIMRVLGQFTPHDWLEFSWRPQSSLKRWGGMLCIIIMLFLAELGTFYLKFILWIPPPHLLCVGRLLFFLLAGSVAMRELFEYMDNP
ncbi:unnamed protein product [Didymodactylos carnosus]|uniref:Phosphatidylserine synthase n=1 Tax=Didymodactylos carnosus TaxID=1234261 RepID=A0A813NUM5_9BILA|nr:unnamed protein product [Didymodactylos carnosus]CAF1055850.1 unnamed protein product [Didymodactylos carnosus]CAF3523985.1 unnamed protein product [Didymodactylos carnosus]CAF3822063.1 unnamed protein product [Didymodactylos carnosus]